MKVCDLEYGYSRKRLVLDGLSFVSDARRIAILGPNGAGKSTLMAIMSSVRKPSSGYFAVGHYDSRSPSGLREYRARLGVVPQHSMAFGGLTCREFLGYVAWLRTVPARAAEEHIDRVLSAVGLAAHADEKLKTYSGGMRQRASLAQALVNEPQLLLLDEPTVSLDPAQRDAYLLLLREIESPTTVVMTSHVVDDIAAFADDVVVVRDGVCRFAGPLMEFCSTAPGDTPTGQEVKEAYVRLLGLDTRL